MTSSKKTAESKRLKESTPARILVGKAGTRPTTSHWLKFRHDHALARDAVLSELSKNFIESFVRSNNYPLVQSEISNRKQFVLDPPGGKRLPDHYKPVLLKECPQGNDLQIVVCDGLSAMAVEANVPDLIGMLIDGCETEGITCGKPVFVKYGRVAIADQIGHLLKAKLAINLIGERPGLSSGVGLSAYMTYNPGPNTISSHRTVISNISKTGTPPPEAGAYALHLIKKILEHKKSGVELQQLL